MTRPAWALGIGLVLALSGTVVAQEDETALSVKEQQVVDFVLKYLPANLRGLDANQRSLVIKGSVFESVGMVFGQTDQAQVDRLVREVSKRLEAVPSSVPAALPGQPAASPPPSGPSGEVPLPERLKPSAPGAEAAPPVAAPPAAEPPAAASVLSTSNMKAIEAHLKEVDSYLRTDIGAGTDQVRMTRAERVEAMQAYVRGAEFQKFLSKLMSNAPETLSAADLEKLDASIERVAGRSTKDAEETAPQEDDSVAADSDPRIDVGQVVSILDDVADIAGVPTVSEFSTLASDVVELVESPGFSAVVQSIGSSGLFRCKTRSRAVLVPSTSRVVVRRHH